MAFTIVSSLRKTILVQQGKMQPILAISIRNKSRDDYGDKSSRKINSLQVRGIDVLRDPKLNKGTAFTLKERQLMGIHGLVPPIVNTMEQQAVRIMTNFDKFSSDLNKFIYLIGLQDRNEKLFYKILCDHVERMLPIVYTPTVGLACQQYGVVFRRPRGLFVSIKDKGHIYDMLSNWPERNIKAVVVTDGERILGLGDLGAYGMGIPVGKLSLYTALGGIPPSYCLPVLLDVGTNNKKLHADPLYIGLVSNRVTGQEYDDFIDEFVEAVAKMYGSHCLIQFEDFGNHNAFHFMEKYRNKYCTFNDDIQGTAAVAVAGVFAGLRITQQKLCDSKFFFLGAGEASLGIAGLLCLAMQETGISREEACNKIWLADVNGLVTKDRAVGDNSGHKREFVKDYKHMTDLEEMIDELQPTVLMGASAAAGAFTEKVLKSMALHNDRPIIFALSNPTSRAECTAEQAYTFTDGRCIFASGSPFLAVTYKGKTFYPGQGNNAYIFPGVALCILTCRVRHIPDTIFLRAAKCLSELVTDEDLSEGRVYPPLSVIQDVSFKIAVNLAEYVYKNNLASAYPEPANKEAFIRSFIYDSNYETFEPVTWDWSDK